MNKMGKLFLFLVSIMLVFNPSFVYAEEEVTGGEVETPEVVEPTEPVVPEEPEELKSIKLDMDGTESTLKPGDTLLIEVIVTPSNTNVTWVSSDDTVARVDNGLVTALSKAGEVIITAKINDVLKVEYKVIVDVPKSDIATLDSLKVNGTFDKEFKSDVFEYNVMIAKDVTSLEFEYVLSDSNATAFKPADSKNKNLKNGDVLSFKVVAENGEDNNTYKFTVVKEASSLNLKSLMINGYALNEIFAADNTDYTASIPYEIDTLTIRANTLAADSEVSMKVSGITNLKVGDNKVKIVVTDKSDSTKTKTYTIVVTREKKVTVQENPTSIITSSGGTGENNSSTSKPSNNNIRDNVGEEDNFLKYAIVSLACFILFMIGGIGIYFYIKTSPRKLKKETLNNKKIEEKVNNNDTSKNQENIEKLMEEKLIETREFKHEDLKQLVETENLFDDEEDV